METEGWWACWTPTLPPPPPRTLPAAPLLAGCASPSRQSPLQLLLASGSRQEGGHGGTSPFRQSSALTCTRPCPQSGGWGWGGVEDGHQAGDTERPSEGSHSPTPTPGLPPQMPPPPQPSSSHLCHLHRAAGHRVPSLGGARGRGHHHSWAGGPYSFSDDSDGRPHTRRCRAPRPPTQPTPQPLRGSGRKNGGEPGGEPQELPPR